MGQRLVKPEVVISLKKIDQLREIEADPIFLKIGSGVTLDRVITDETTRREFSGLVEALEAIGHPTCQHFRATLGGNLLLETRCLYYNQSSFWRRGHERCFKAGGQVCLVLPESKECSSASLSDGATMLVALSAQVRIVSEAGERIIPAADLFTGRGESPLDLRPEEVLAEIKLPRPVNGFGSAYRKLRYRSYLDFSLISAAAAVRLEKDQIDRARLVIAGAGPAPLVVTEVEQLLGGQKPDEELTAQAAAAAEKTASGKIVSNLGVRPEYRRQMVRVVASQALAAAVNRAKQ
jgi:4-hydroxybenzoyl-CoA reductase subunit beta